MMRYSYCLFLKTFPQIINGLNNSISYENSKESISNSLENQTLYIKKETSKLSKKLYEKLEKDLSSVENDLICSFKSDVEKTIDQNILNAYEKHMRKKKIGIN